VSRTRRVNKSKLRNQEDRVQWVGEWKEKSEEVVPMYLPDLQEVAVTRQLPLGVPA
jgi:hypothetical protein